MRACTFVPGAVTPTGSADINTGCKKLLLSTDYPSNLKVCTWSVIGKVDSAMKKVANLCCAQASTSFKESGTKGMFALETAVKRKIVCMQR